MGEELLNQLYVTSQPKKILLLGAGFTTRNMGVWALASGAITSTWHMHPDARIYLLDYHTESANYEVKHPGGTGVVQLINLRFSKKFWLPNNILRLLLTALLIRIIPSRSFKNQLICHNFWLCHIKTSDIVGSIAGGDSFSDIYGIGRLIYVALPQILALLMGKPLMLLPQTVGPFKSSLGRTVARYILNRAWKVYSRDKESLDKARNIVPRAPDRMAFCYDMGFVLEPGISEERIPRRLVELDPGTPLVGLNVSGLLYMGGYTRKNMFGLKADYRRVILDLIDHFVKKYNARLMLVPHVIGSIENSESDTTACHEIYREAGNRLQEHLHVISEEYDQHELKALIGRCDFFIGSRMHACIAALSQCIPAVGLAYSRKFRGVFASIGVEELVLDLRKSGHNWIMETVDQAYERRKHFRKQLEAKMPSVRASIMELFAKIITECPADVNVHACESVATGSRCN